MRKAYHNLAVYRNDIGELIGVGLGSDFCAEHEWGIKKLKNRFKIDDTKDGIEKRAITTSNVFAGDFIYEKTKYYFLTSYENKYCKDEKDYKNRIRRYLGVLQYDKEITSAWDEEDFVFAVKDKSIRDLIKESFDNLDILIFLGGRGPFNNGSLNIVIKSRFPEEEAETMLQSDLSYKRLIKAVEKTGIVEKLKKAGKGYHALSPKWKDETEKEIIYWLNPYEQNVNNSGWVTEKDLHDWIKNKGVIIKDKK